MTPQRFTQELESLLGKSLLTVALYGSAISGEQSAKYSNYNLLVICDRLGLDELKRIRPLTNQWAQFGNPPPLLFTWERLKNSSDVFPIELLDVKENHLILQGEDLLKRLPISQSNLRYQLEHELKGKLIQLRESYLLTDGSDEAVAKLMIASLSTFQVLLRAMLRFLEVRVPIRKREAVKRLSIHVPFDLTPFDEIQDLKEEKTELALIDVPQLFQSYLASIENVADLASRLGRQEI